LPGAVVLPPVVKASMWTLWFSIFIVGGLTFAFLAYAADRNVRDYFAYGPKDADDSGS
jgi:hypothetical protein